MNLSRRDFLQLMAAGAAAGLVTGCAAPVRRVKQIDYSRVQAVSDRIYNLEMKGNVRLLHMANLHGQLKPLYYREPNTQMGFHQYENMAPNQVGRAKLAAYGIQPNSLEAHALTSLNFNQASQIFGKVGGSAHLKTLLDQLRTAAGGVGNTLTVDSGNAWQGSAMALWSKGRTMVEVSNRLLIDAMTGHWDLMYDDDDVLRNVELFNGDFLAQNIRLKRDVALQVFKPYSIKTVKGHKIAIIGQSFSSRSPTPAYERDSLWHFGTYELELQTLVAQIRAEEQPAIVVLLSANETAVNVALANQVEGLDVILGGASYDSMPEPIKIETDLGHCFVASSGCYGKFVSVLDFTLSDYGVQSLTYTLLPVFANFIRPDQSMEAFVDRAYQEPISAGTHKLEGQEEQVKAGQILSKPITKNKAVLYRKDDFFSAWDQVVVNALMAHYQVPIAMTIGLRFGTTVPLNKTITVEDVMNQVAIRNSQVQLKVMTGVAIKKHLEASLEARFSSDPYERSGLDVVRLGGLSYNVAPTKPYGQRVSDLAFIGKERVKMGRQYPVALWDGAAVSSKTEKSVYIWNVMLNHLEKSRPLRLKGYESFPQLIGVAENQGVEHYSGEII